MTSRTNGAWAWSIASAPSARNAPETLRCATTIIMPSEQRDGVEIDGPEGFLEAQGPERDHRRAAEEGDPRAVEPQARNAACRDPDIGQDEDDERGGAFAGHSPAAPSIARGALARSVACSSRVSGMNAKKTRKAMAAAAPRARNETE